MKASVSIRPILQYNLRNHGTGQTTTFELRYFIAYAHGHTRCTVCALDCDAFQPVVTGLGSDISASYPRKVLINNHMKQQTITVETYANNEVCMRNTSFDYRCLCLWPFAIAPMTSFDAENVVKCIIIDAYYWWFIARKQIKLKLKYHKFIICFQYFKTINN